MVKISVWISDHSLFTAFLLGAVLSAIGSIIFLRIYGLFFLPPWFEIVTYAGEIVGGLVYYNIVESVDLAVISGIITVALFYGMLALGLRWMFGMMQKKREVA